MTAKGSIPASIAPCAQDKPDWFMVGILTATSMMAFFHRQLLILLGQPIKQELHISDTDLGLLFGLMFTFSYAAMAFPVARIADQVNRVRLIAICLFLWSLFTSLHLFARSYASLALLRISVGASESGLTPAASALLSDRFRGRSLAMPMALFSMGIYLGNGLAMVGGGALSRLIDPLGHYVLPIMGQISGWNLILLLAGLPGMALTLLVLTLRDPRSPSAPPPAAVEAQDAVIAEGKGSGRWLRTYGWLMSAITLNVFVGNASNAWIPAMLERRFAWNIADIGTYYGLSIIICGATGAIAGGWLSARLRNNQGQDASQAVMLFCFFLLAPLSVGFPLMPNPYAAIVLIGLMNGFAGATIGLSYAMIQMVTASHMRARMSAILVIAVNIIGAGLGPFSVAFLTDHFYGGPALLPYSMATVAGIASPLAFLLLLNHFRLNPTRSIPA